VTGLPYVYKAYLYVSNNFQNKHKLLASLLTGVMCFPGGNNKFLNII
jgi:hypothetical protein